MTYEEFKDRALNPVYTVEPSIYRVDIFRIVDPNGNKLTDVLAAEDDINHSLESDLKQIDESEGTVYYPQYKVNKSESYIFPTFDDAIRFINSEIVSSDNNNQIFCIGVHELPFGKNVISDCCKREWVFDCEGNILEQSVCSSLMEDLDKPEGNFWGRPKNSIRFKLGEIVEVFDKERWEVRLAVIVALLNDIDSCWSEYQKVMATCELEGVGTEKADSNYWLYAGNDCYSVAYGTDFPNDCGYANTTDVFIPHFSIPDELRTHLLNAYEIQSKLDLGKQ